MDGNSVFSRVSFHSLDVPQNESLRLPNFDPSAADGRILKMLCNVPQVVCSCGAIRDSNGVIGFNMGN
jgi:hypothetical protein